MSDSKRDPQTGRFVPATKKSASKPAADGNKRPPASNTLGRGGSFSI